MSVDQMFNCTFSMPIAATSNTALYMGGMLAKISKDGDVAIDWERVEKVASDPLSDGTQLAYARLMIAIRDKTYTAL